MPPRFSVSFMPGCHSAVAVSLSANTTRRLLLVNPVSSGSGENVRDSRSVVIVTLLPFLVQAVMTQPPTRCVSQQDGISTRAAVVVVQLIVGNDLATE